MDAINSFAGEYSFLSNFYPAEVEWEGVLYPTVEHAFQAAKTIDTTERESVRLAASPVIAKRLGRQVTLRTDWDSYRLEVMEHLVRDKFTRHTDLGAQLLATENAELIEGNTWRDTFWGVYKGRGQNHLGRILMKVRDELTSEK